ncbi:methyl-accepting chemotaxis protein [Methylobacter sp.]|uniref:methyl-accepting chemotaxis protein n=1 Tax=Methylobacter sp. TaxID=2051955 RepID=UPI002FDDCD2E
MNKLSFKARIFSGYVLIIGMMMIIVTSTLLNYAHTEQNLKTIKNTYLPNALVSSVMAHEIVILQQFLTDVAATHDSEGLADARTTSENFKKNLEDYRQRLSDDPEEQNNIKLLEANFDKFYSDGKRMAFTFMDKGIDAGNAFMDDFDGTADRLTMQIGNIRAKEAGAVKNSIDEITDYAHKMYIILLVLSAIIVVMAFIIATLLTRHLSKQIGIDPVHAKGIAKEIAKGNLSRQIYLNDDDDSSLLHAMKEMQQELLERRNTEQKATAEILRIKNALDNTSTGIMIADNHRQIVYTNKSAISIIRAMEAKIRERIPDFSTDKLEGSSMDDFHQKPQHQADLLESLIQTYSADLALDQRTIRVIANPVINEQGQRLGTVAEWHDRTAEVVVEQEVAAIVQRAGRGDFSQRFDLEGKEGFLHELSQGLNELLSTSETGLNEIAHVLAAIAHGDLTKTITNDYVGTFGQLKDNANITVEQLKAMIDRIKLAADSIYVGAKEIASGNNDLSHRTETQAAHLQETAASMEEFTAAVQSNADNAKRANELVADAVEIATQGGEVVKNVISTMQNINESSHRIEDIITVIDDIAFQTNILALNAAVEAARAGEQGRGFAVVAIEVRNLAQRAATAADEIKRLIADSVTKVNDGSQLVTQAGDTMNRIIDAIQGVTAIMTGISTASDEQNADISQVNQAIRKMDTVTQQNAALVEQSAAAAESLEEQAQNLALVIGDFKL